MKNSVFLAVLLMTAFALSGCAGEMKAMDYDWVKQQEFPYQGTNWQIMDRSAESRLMIRPAFGAMMSDAFDKNFSGEVKTNGWRSAASAWLSNKGKCEILSEDKIGDFAREIKYHCT